MKQLFFLAMFSLSLGSCSEKDPEVSSLQKSHSVEVTYQTKKLNPHCN